jgi:predicted short-subunit dehydrogenase-like oxidoreductase (DUF2520 family)
MVHYTISFAGAGRVAGTLCREMYHEGHTIRLIVSESEKRGGSLARSCEAEWSRELKYFGPTDIVIVAVPDHMLEEVLYKIDCPPDTLVVHTAGSIGLDVFPEKIRRKGILYPLQTFSPERKVLFRDLPFFLESADKTSLGILEDLSKSIGGKVYFADTDHRRLLHLAAIFVCNFTNHMLTAGKDIATKAGFPFEVLRPLIEETFSKALEIGPEKSQTGPAVRNDRNTIEKHLELLSFSPELQQMYKEITMSIIKFHNKS